jgi:gliding motility-associated lipoprotein GldH
MKRFNFFALVALSLFLLGIYGCDTSNLIDTNEEMPQRNWSYVNKLRTTVEIKDPAAAYHLKFRLRHTADYRYSNIYVLMRLSGSGYPVTTRRFGYKLAEPDGQWLGQGSGNLYTSTFTMFSNFKFPQAGKYTIEIEQNMRDNPLKEISDAGITVTQVKLP